MNVFIHPLSDVRCERIGAGTRIWQFCVVLPGAEIGAGCNLCAGCFVEGGARIGNHVTIKNNVAVWDGVMLGDEVFVGPNVTFTNDKNPRSGNREFHLQPTRVERGASIGGGAVILSGLTIGAYATVGAGAVVTRDVPPHTTVVGNPARVLFRGST